MSINLYNCGLADISDKQLQITNFQKNVSTDKTTSKVLKSL